MSQNPELRRSRAAASADPENPVWQCEPNTELYCFLCAE